MSTLAFGTDRFEIVNGPEDGTKFPITRSPIDLGNEQTCDCYIHFEPGHPRQNARVSVVSEGYRVRNLGRGEIAVDGEKVSLLKSRVVREGGIIRVGGTDLCLVTANGGLAKRSSGVPAENDAAWLARYTFKHARRNFKNILGFIWRLPRIILAKWKWMLVAALIGAYFVPEFRYYIFRWLRYFWNETRSLFTQLPF